MKKLFIAPHPDDECLWGAYTIQRELPFVVIVRDLRALWRNEESIMALDHLGVPYNQIRFVDKLCEVSLAWDAEIEKVYAPAMQGGHPLHDELCEQSIRRWGAKVILYSAYGKKKDEPPYGRWKVESTERQRKRKIEALRFYESQHRVAAVHFNLKSKDEYYF